MWRISYYTMYVLTGRQESVCAYAWTQRKRFPWSIYIRIFGVKHCIRSYFYYYGKYPTKNTFWGFPLM
jgi:hypothetical protein